MARPREFNADEVLDRASAIFQAQSVQATSMRQLEAETGVKQVSLYNAFGSKEQFFLAVLERYAALIESRFDEVLADRGLNGIRDWVSAITAPGSPIPNACLGCLMVNTAFAADTAGPAIHNYVVAFRARMLARFRAALEDDKARGKLRRALDLDECAEFIVCSLFGIQQVIRLMGRETAGRPAAKVLLRTLASWRMPTASGSR